MGCKAGPDRVCEEVLECRAEVLFIVNDPGRETRREQGAAPAVTRVVLSRIVALRPLHCEREVLCSGVDNCVVMRAHQTVSVEADPEARCGTVEERQEHAPIRGVAKEHRLVHASGGHVEVAVRKLGT